MSDEEVLPVDKHKLAQWKKSADELLSDISEHPCDSEALAEWWSDVLEESAQGLKRLDDERTELTKPLLEQKRLVDECYKPAKVATQALVDLARKKLQAWQEGQAQRALAAQKAASLAAESGDYSAARDAIAAAPAPLSAAGTATQWVWEYVVVDEHAVPVHLKSVDPLKVQAALKGKEVAEIQGLKLTRTAKVRRTGKKT